MKTAYIVVFLSLLALGRAATLACKQLQKPVETRQENEHVNDFMLLSKRKQLNADELQEFETQVMCYGGKKTDVFKINEPTECIMIDKGYAEEMDYKDSMQFFKRIKCMDLV
ncbi:hypothetical protein CRUP_017327, partial [Coryphaenoides rupestris]